MKRNILLAAIALLLTACGSDTVYNSEHTFKGNIWNHFTPEVFDIDITNTEDYYNIDFIAAVDTAVYRYDNVPVMIELTSPNGEERQFYGVVFLKENGRWRGEMEDGYRTASGRIRSYFSFNSQGTHHMEVTHTTSQYDLEGVHSLAVVITKAKIDYDM